MLNVTIGYRTTSLNFNRTTCIVDEPKSQSESEEIFNFFWMLSQSNLVAEFQVRDSSGYSVMPRQYGWACDKWVERICYTHE